MIVGFERNLHIGNKKIDFCGSHLPNQDLAESLVGSRLNLLNIFQGAVEPALTTCKQK
jgi:hypothetical protein